MPDGLFDTVILIDHLNHVPEAAAILALHPDAAISIITWIEVLTGAPHSDEHRTRSLLSLLINISPEIAERAAVIRRQPRMKLPDSIILATVEIEGRVLITRNTRDFLAGDSRIHVPYRI